jgi:hypothetical protein
VRHLNAPAKAAQARHASMGLHKMGFLRTVIDGGVQVFKGTLE